jgi:hypothetical protein
MFVIEVVGCRWNEASQRWSEARTKYVTRIGNRKRAINWALRKVEREYPGFNEYEATILDQ